MASVSNASVTVYLIELVVNWTTVVRYHRIKDVASDYIFDYVTHLNNQGQCPILYDLCIFREFYLGGATNILPDDWLLMIFVTKSNFIETNLPYVWLLELSLCVQILGISIME